MFDLDYAIEVEQEYCRLTCTGMMSAQGLHWLMGEIVANVDPGQRNILVDLRGMAGTLDTMERFELGVATAKKLGGRRLVVIAEKEKINRIAETVAVNRGAEILMAFDSETALSWLLKDA